MNRHLCIVLAVFAGALLPRGVAGDDEFSTMRWNPLLPLPDAHGFAAPVVGRLGERLVVAGGSNFPDEPVWNRGQKAWYDEIFVLDPGKSEWISGGRLPRPVGHAISASHNDKMFVFGGQNGTEIYAGGFAIEDDEGRIAIDSDLPPLPIPLTMAAGALVGSVLYVAGGVSSLDSLETTSAFFALDLAHLEKGWVELPSWPGPPRCLAAAAARGDKFVIVGGLSRLTDLTPDAYLSDAYVYSPDVGWSDLPPLPHAAAAAASPMPVAADGTLVLIGGADGTQLGLPPQTYPLVPRRALLLSPDASSWREASNPPIGRVTVQTVEWNDGWFLPTGESSPGVRSPETWFLRLTPPEL